MWLPDVLWLEKMQMNDRSPKQGLQAMFKTEKKATENVQYANAYPRIVFILKNLTGNFIMFLSKAALRGIY